MVDLFSEPSPQKYTHNKETFGEKYLDDVDVDITAENKTSKMVNS